MVEEMAYGRRVYFSTKPELIAFISEYSDFFTCPKKRPDGFEETSRGGIYKILPVEYKGDITYYPLKFYMTSSSFNNYVEPKCTYRRISGVNTYVFTSNRYTKGSCINCDCYHYGSSKKCILPDSDYDWCIKHDYGNYIGTMRGGYPIHSEPVHCASGCRFGW